MTHSNIPNSILSKYSRILVGIVFTATSVLPLATSAMAQTVNPALTIVGITRTTPVPASSEVVYRIVVKNTTSVAAHKVKITDNLPTGFVYGKHLTTLQKGAVMFGSATKFVDTEAANKPTVGANTVTWNNITIPANSSIEFIFTATASATAGTYPMPSLKVDYYNSAASTTIITTNANLSSTADDVVLKPIPPTPTLSVSATSGSTSIEETICALPGVDGIAANITGIVNTYFKPTLQSVGVGTTNTQSITIAAGAAKGDTTKDIRPGDLVLIVQMQDASINTANSALYGSGADTNQGSGQTTMGSSGLYEYAIANSTVLAASGSATLNLKRPLLNTYTSAAKTTTSGQKRFQVVRVPQYASAKILGTMFASPWDGNVGGILAVDTFGNFDLNGQRLSVNEAGFRGGYGPKSLATGIAHEGYVSPTTTAYTNVNGTGSLSGFGSGKGEGVAGTPRYLSTKSSSNVDPIDGSPIWNGLFADSGVDGYPGGDTGRGAPANAGGGGNYHNSGGGGGGNGGNGGQGSLGYGYVSVLKDAGGRPGSSSLINTPTPVKVFMGGGGGGGEANHALYGVAGGAGGGIVMLRAGKIVGPGSIYANGSKGDRGAQGTNPDGAGGGGAGGTVLIQSRNPAANNIEIEAKGGQGGSTEQDSFYDYKLNPITNTASQTASGGYSVDGYPYPHNGQTPHGPGGGGAGGIVLYNVTGTATIAPVVTGGSSGTTDDLSPSTTLTNTNNGVLLRTLGGKTSHSNGATAGSSGQVVAFTGSQDRFTDLNNRSSCLPNLSMVMTTSTPNRIPGELVSYKMTVTNTASIGQAATVSLQNRLPSGFTYDTTNSIVLNGGAVPALRPTTPTQVNPPTPPTGTPSAAVLAQLKKPVWGTFTIPPGAKVEINFQARINTRVGNGLYRDKADAIYPDPARTTANQMLTNSYGDDPAQNGADVRVTTSNVEMVWNFLKSATNWSK